jgi:hypothetical protein
MSERQCDLCKRDMPLGSAFWPEMAELSFSIGEHKCVCQDCFMRQPGMGQAVAQFAEQMLRAHAQRDIDDPYWVFNRSTARKKDQMSEEVKTSIGKVGAVDIAPTDTATRGLGVEVALRRAKAGLDADYPPFNGDPAGAKYDPRAKAMVRTKIDEALLWLTKIGALFALLLCCSCGGLAIVRDKLASYHDELAVFCPQSNISQDCIDARRRAEVAMAAVQTATLGEQIGRDAQNLITQADNVIGAALAEFKKVFLNNK